MIGPPRWVEPFLSIPYVDGGRDEHGCDCWGLVRLLYERRGIELAQHAVAPTNIRGIVRAFGAGVDSGEWIAAAGVPQPFDVCLMLTYAEKEGRTLRYTGHCGLVLTESLLLHTAPNTGPTVVRLTDPLIKPRIASRWRHRELT